MSNEEPFHQPRKKVAGYCLVVFKKVNASVELFNIFELQAMDLLQKQILLCIFSEQLLLRSLKQLPLRKYHDSSL